MDNSINESNNSNDINNINMKLKEYYNFIIEFCKITRSLYDYYNEYHPQYSKPDIISMSNTSFQKINELNEIIVSLENNLLESISNFNQNNNNSFLLNFVDPVKGLFFLIKNRQFETYALYDEFLYFIDIRPNYSNIHKHLFLEKKANFIKIFNLANTIKNNNELKNYINTI